MQYPFRDRQCATARSASAGGKRRPTSMVRNEIDHVNAILHEDDKVRFESVSAMPLDHPLAPNSEIKQRRSQKPVSYTKNMSSLRDVVGVGFDNNDLVTTPRCGQHRPMRTQVEPPSGRKMLTARNLES